MIKIYTDNTFLNDDNYRAYIYPLLTLLRDNNPTLAYAFSLVNTIKESHIVILPVAIEYLFKRNKKAYVSSFIENAKEFDKPVFTFTSGDIGLSIKDLNVYNLRLGGFKSKMNARTFMMPPFIIDPYLFFNKEVLYLKKTQLPTVGFVGHSNGSFIKLIKEFLLYLKTTFKVIFRKEYIDYQSFYPSSFFRHKYLLKLQAFKEDINTNFIFRKNYRAGAKTKEEKYKTSLEFYNNIFQNQYTFCMRGVGNWSVRFYETLAMGRIPILINTDCNLPFSKKIKWDKHCVIVNDNKFKTINSKLKQFHSQFTEEGFIELQKSNRELWINYFAKESFFKVMAADIENLIKR